MCSGKLPTVFSLLVFLSNDIDIKIYMNFGYKQLIRVLSIVES